MKKLKSTRFTTAMAACVALTMLAAGCSSSKTTTDSGSSQTPQSTSTSQTEPATDKTYQISWSVNNLLQPVDKDAEMVRYWNDKFNINLDIWNIESNNYQELINLKFASNEIPDRLSVGSFQDLQKYVDQDIVAEIPLEMLQKYAPNIYAKTEKELPGAFNYAKVDDKIYGIPKLIHQARFREPVIWRGDWLKNVGIEKSPETLEEFEQALYKIANEDPDKNNKKDTYGLSKSALNMIYGAFGYLPTQWAEKDGKLVYGAVQPEMKQALALLNKWFKDKVIDPEFVTGENQGGYWALSHAFINGRIGLTGLGAYYHWKPLLFEGDGNSHDYVELKKVNAAAADSLVYGMPPKGTDGLMGTTQANLINGTFIAFGKQLEKEPDKLAKILQVIDGISADSYENYLTATYGIKGKTWDFDANQIPVYLNGLTITETSKMGAGNTMESLELIEFVAKRNEKVEGWAKENNYTEGGKKDSLLAPLPSGSKYLVELDKIREQAYIAIITGEQPVDYFDEFVKKWKSNGGDQLEKEANEWYANAAK
ncbi:extracellular solute-binding protein [Paenibacillus eucommiae]|uniref:Aldouronate transport system substrate-binding protein n=1 Tax=Paenibacillus eucommiae TaxID=1355755 RepID=A0ABS4IPB4_9BACL|nr:extracellular solute-binding protein [Paenibacillus eucommiae]MBP1989406.1 putative aldouronate transport system substrate-binding protein [Paenibacillus eucommiae]